ncbi:hypothetical protein AGMMS49957_06930 [Synergistales bacterium]|nr:hypothetical protein AGMMS49957_06930 [Synergistales bacterium]
MGLSPHKIPNGIISTAIFVTIGSPAKILVVVGSLNGLILPLSLGCVLLASRRKDIIGDYIHPSWMIWSGVLMVIFTGWMGFNSLSGILNLFK